MVELTDNLKLVSPDPVRSWITKLKEFGATKMFTIGIPDPVPKEIIEVYAKAAYNEDLTNKVSYTPVKGEDALKKNIIVMENNFNVKLTEEDSERILPTIAASQALQFYFSLFKTGSEILVQAPAWGTIYSMIGHSGNTGVPCEYFVDGKFTPENVDAAITEKTQAAYINLPSNPQGFMPKSGEIKKFTEYVAGEKGLQVISDSPYKYHLYSGEYYSPINSGGDIADNVTLVSSFSKIIKPDIRLGYIRLAPAIWKADTDKKIVYYFRNLGASTSRAIQIGVSAVIDHDPKLSFLKPIVKGYEKKSALMRGYLEGMGAKFDVIPNASYLLFPKTPGDINGEEYVKEMAKDYQIGFLPGSSFSAGMPKYDKYFRVGIGGGMSGEKIKEIMESI
ncbi:MAG TPA: pyridoxal phosphate-dependent aminotransferase [Candidatus Altiarchaeales archaeon]|nr:pyridoxal phosphate-dependent aminotransferase [Candidatus Altiarchaeales archaeon]